MTTVTTTTADPNKLMTLREVAARLGVGEATAARLRAAGKLPAPVRVGTRLVRWHPGELDNWIRAGCPGAIEWGKLKTARPRAQYVGSTPVC